MARVPLVDENDPHEDPEKVAAVNRFLERHGRVANVQRALANHPVLMNALFDLADLCYFGGGLDDRQRELPYLTSAMVLECFY